MSGDAVQTKYGLIRDILERSDLGAIVLGRFANFAWYTGGADNRVDHASPFGVAQVVITRDRAHVLTNSIEAERLKAEQTPKLDIVSYPWYEDPTPTLRELSAGGPIGSDGAVPDSSDVSTEVAMLRRVLDADAMVQYREVGQLTVAAVDEAAGETDSWYERIGSGGPPGSSLPAARLVQPGRDGGRR